MSSAILYLAIVAIWACVLVPRWLRRPHDAAPESQAPAGNTEAVFYAEAPDHGDYGTEAEFGTGQAVYADPGLADSEAQAGTGEYSGSSAWSDSRAWSDSQAWPGAQARPDSQAWPGAQARSGFAAPEGSGLRPGAARANRYGPARPPAPGSGRARVLQARRRMLTVLVALAAAAMACGVTGLTTWWTAVPPVGMLLAYMLLLREAARADAEAVRHAEAYARYARAQAARAAYERAREAHVQARAASLPQPAAEIIDISHRTAEAADQLYDQYADANVRAVGD
ncbi:MAG TPA: hypothetical protein VGR98_27880 [Streptosporangiaceae bacterium]|nr:hypothetical protein [Streptosporangiaceae bacterium]